MTNKRKVEVFTAGCPVCKPVVELVSHLACPSCDVVIYDIKEGCETNECRDKVKAYGITQLPAIAVNGKLLDCCKKNNITKESLQAAGIGVR